MLDGKLTDKEARFVEMLSITNPDDETLKEMAHTIDNMSNNFGFHYREVVAEANEDPVKKENLLILAMAWIKYWSKKPEYYFDGRNKMSGERCREIADIDAFKTYIPSSEEMFDAYTRMMELPYIRSSTLECLHKTLMQTTTKMLLYVINQSKDPTAQEITKEMNSLLGYDDWGEWYGLPFI